MKVRFWWYLGMLCYVVLASYFLVQFWGSALLNDWLLCYDFNIIGEGVLEIVFFSVVVVGGAVGLGKLWKIIYIHEIKCGD